MFSFNQVREFLESWGLGLDTADHGDFSSTIRYPQIYDRMCEDAIKSDCVELQKFISSITDTFNSETYLAKKDWNQVKRAYNVFVSKLNNK